MEIELIIIGEEILEGSVQDANTLAAARIFSKHGYRLIRQTTVSDDVKCVCIALEEALQRSDIVVTSGGLGSTVNDVTRKAVAQLVGCPLVIDQPLYDKLIRCHALSPAVIANMALIPQGAILLDGGVGTASGWIVETKHRRKLIALPGSTNEFCQLLEHLAVPRVLVSRGAFLSDMWSVLFTPEQEINEHIVRLQQDFPSIIFGIYPDNPTPGVVLISVSSHTLSFSSFSREALQILDRMKAVYPDRLYRTPSRLIEEAVHLHFLESAEKIAFAESCTGGAIAARITRFSGASRYFLGSFVVYSDAMKRALLDVDSEILSGPGAVSEECVQAMLEGVFTRTDADWGVAVSGIAGPLGDTPGKPVGTIYYALGKKDGVIVSGKLPFVAKDTRETLIQRAGTYVLGCLWQEVHKCT